MGYKPRRSVRAVAVAALTACAAFAAASPAAAFDPQVEAENYSKTHERSTRDFLLPENAAQLEMRNVLNSLETLGIQITDPERQFELFNLCYHRNRECAGEFRFYDWEAKGRGLVKPVLFTARSGATLSGNVWATRKGPKQRPGVVITTGSVQAPETLYWGIAATLAKHGYVVLTYDVQGQGRSDTLGEGDDEFESVPAQSGQPFYDGTEDALDFLLSGPEDPYVPRPSCSTGTSHAAKQDRRVDEGFNAAYNPLRDLVDEDRIGIAGHSLGATGVSYIGQIDDRVDAIVAWDNLGTGGSPPACASGSSTRTPSPPLTKPAIGMSNDYGLVFTPQTADPNPEGRNGAFSAFKTAGVDSMQVNIRGGTHFEYSYIPSVEFDATLRGMSFATWYTTAWLDKYVKGDETADDRLLTDRWRDDADGAAIDPNNDGNLFSFYLRSRYDFALEAGGRAVCDDMRPGCASMGPDNEAPGSYDYRVDGLTLDSPNDPPAEPTGLATSPAGPANDNNPELSGNAPVGTTVRVYTTPDCSGTPIATPGAAEFAAGITVTVADDSTTTYRATATDENLFGDPTSDCSQSSATYVEDSTPDPAGPCENEIEGTNSSETLTGTAGGDEIVALGGADTLLGLGADDCLFGEAGTDRLEGAAGADELSGGTEADVLDGGSGRDDFAGNRGADRLLANDGERDHVSCGRGHDLAIVDENDDVSGNCERVRVR